MDIIKQVLLDNNKKLSSKRLAGLLCIICSLLMKILIIFHQMIFKQLTNYQLLEETTNSMLMAGVALIGGGLIELFTKKKK